MGIKDIILEESKLADLIADFQIKQTKGTAHGHKMLSIHGS